VLAIGNEPGFSVRNCATSNRQLQVTSPTIAGTRRACLGQDFRHLVDMANTVSYIGS